MVICYNVLGWLYELLAGMFSSSLTRMIRIVLIVVYISPGQIIIVHFQHVYSQVYTTVSFIFCFHNTNYNFLKYLYLKFKVTKDGTVRLTQTCFSYSLALVHSSQPNQKCGSAQLDSSLAMYKPFNRSAISLKCLYAWSQVSGCSC